MYEHIYWGSEPFCSLLTAVPALYDRTVTVNGVSKSYAMTGWRIGYCGGPPEIVEAMATIQSQSTTNPSSIAQKAATAALLGDQSCVAEMNGHFKARHDFFNAGLNRLPGFKVLPAAGTFYAWCDVSDAIRRLGLPDDDAFAEHLLEQRRRGGRSWLRFRRAGSHPIFVCDQPGVAGPGARAHRPGPGLTPSGSNPQNLRPFSGSGIAQR